MPADLPIRCACGTFRAVAVGVSGARGNHCICYCDDCQAFARFLGRPTEILDAHGGTAVFQTSPARLRIGSGGDRLACMRLTPKGIYRWYAGCCSSPLGNTLAGAKVPFIGLILACVEKPSGDPTLERTLGPIRARAYRRRATGDASQLPRDRLPIALMMLRILAVLAKWKIQGDAKRSPLFDPRTGKPIATPTVLAADERERLRGAAVT